MLGHPDEGVGMARKPNWDWDKDTSPFASCDPLRPQPALFQLQQVTDNDFKLLKPFQYTRADGTVIPVDHQWLGNLEFRQAGGAGGRVLVLAGAVRVPAGLLAYQACHRNRSASVDPGRRRRLACPR
jgi:hypothetical protein